MSGDKTTKALTPKQKRFVDAYMGEARGNATEAARIAGYKGSDTTLKQVASETLAKPYIREEIDRLQSQSPLIATRDERLQILTKIIRSEGIESTKDRLKALDQLSKISGDYIQRVELSGPDGGAVQTETRIDLKSLSLDDLKNLRGD